MNGIASRIKGVWDRAGHIRKYSSLITKEKDAVDGPEYVLAEEFYVAAIEPLIKSDPVFAKIFDMLTAERFVSKAQYFANSSPEQVSVIRYPHIAEESLEAVSSVLDEKVATIIERNDPKLMETYKNMYIWNTPAMPVRIVPYASMMGEDGFLDKDKVLEQYHKHNFGLYQKADLLGVLARNGTGFLSSGIDRIDKTIWSGKGENVLSFWKSVNNLTTYGRNVDSDDDFRPPRKPKRERTFGLPEWLKGGGGLIRPARQPALVHV